MSKAYRCDICGRYYEIDVDSFASLNGKPKNKISVYLDLPSKHNGGVIVKDTCPSCMRDILDRYFGGADEIPEENPPEDPEVEELERE